MDAGRYQFMAVYSYAVTGESPSPTYYMRDKQTNELFRQKLILPDFPEKELHINPRLHSYYENRYHFELDYSELIDAYTENKLSGPLKELVASLGEDEDNSIFVFVDFK